MRSRARQRDPRVTRAGLVGLTAGGAGLTAAAFFLPDIPFWLSLIPLALGTVRGTRPARALAMALFLLWPVVISAIGLTGTGLAPEIVWPGAAALLVGLAALAAWAGIAGTTLLLALVPVFPASPLLPLSGALAGLPGPALWSAVGLLAALLLMTALDAWPAATPWYRAAAPGLLIGLAVLWPPTGPLRAALTPSVTSPRPAPAERAVWQSHPVPQTVTERARWLRMRDAMPQGATVVLGENVFRAEDREARAFWCAAATARDLTLYIGLSAPEHGHRRSLIRRLDPETCRQGAPAAPAIYKARYGIPGLTGTWGPMAGPMAAPEISADWLICLEAFLPWAWAAVLTGDAGSRASQPLLILSNDSAFGPAGGAMATLRRKAAATLARLARRPVYHAETGRTYLIKHTSTPGRGRGRGEDAS